MDEEKQTTVKLEDPEKLTPEQIAKILPLLDEYDEFSAKTRAAALNLAKNGTAIPGYKLVEGRSVSKYVDQKAVARRLEEMGYDTRQFYRQPELVTISDFKRLVGKNGFKDFEDLIEKPAGKITLVPESDKRQPVALSIFADDEIK